MRSQLIANYAAAQLIAGALILTAFLAWDHYMQEKKRGRGPWHKQ